MIAGWFISLSENINRLALTRQSVSEFLKHFESPLFHFKMITSSSRLSSSLTQYYLRLTVDHFSQERLSRSLRIDQILPDSFWTVVFGSPNRRECRLTGYGLIPKNCRNRSKFICVLPSLFHTCFEDGHIQRGNKLF